MVDKIAILIPCYNEEKTIEKVIRDFKKQLPKATIYVYDNNSTDNTILKAQAAGAIIGKEYRQGKGHVVRRMFSDINADFYVLVDGDDTYDPLSVQPMLERIKNEKLDMLVGSRAPVSEQSHRMGHRLGNKVFNLIVRLLFGQQFKDIFSGYRVFSKRFVKSFPCLSSGFEIETEITVHALEMNLPVAEIATKYFSRPVGSSSKLNTFRDGFRVAKTIIQLFKLVKPLVFFTIIAFILCLFAICLFIPIFNTFIETGQVMRIPTIVLITGLMLTAAISIFSGMILENVGRARLEAKRLNYLSS